MALDPVSDLDYIALSIDSTIEVRLAAVAVSYLATMEKIQEIAQLAHREGIKDRFEAKMRLKDVLGSAMQYSVFLHENSVMALAKCVEDTKIELARDLEFRFDSFKNDHGVRNAHSLRMVRALANVIRHNVSEIRRNSSSSAKFLVDECDAPDGWDLGTLILNGSPLFDIAGLIVDLYIALLDLLRIATGYDQRLLHLDADEAFREVYELLVPDALSLRRPMRGSAGN